LRKVLIEANNIFNYNKNSLKIQDQLLLMLLLEVVESDFEIGDYDNFLIKAKALDKEMIKESKVNFGKDSERDPLLVEADYYHEQARNNWGPGRTPRFSALFLRLTQEHPELFNQESLAQAAK
jgi:hypothetical protein